MKPHEIRIIHSLELRDAPADSGHIGVLVGHAALFDSDSVEFSGWDKPWIERVGRGAFTRTLEQSPDVLALWSHRSDQPIARAPATMKLVEDDIGLAFEINLIDTQRNRDLRADIKAGNVDAMSFGFEARKTSWEEGKDRDIRTLEDVDLFEVSPVIWPAYPGTRVSARSLVARASGPDFEAEMRAISAERTAFFAGRRGSETPPPPPSPSRKYFPALRLIV